MTDRTDFAAVEAELNARGFTRMVFELDRIESLLDLLGSMAEAMDKKPKALCEEVGIETDEAAKVDVRDFVVA